MGSIEDMIDKAAEEDEAKKSLLFYNFYFTPLVHVAKEPAERQVSVSEYLLH